MYIYIYIHREREVDRYRYRYRYMYTYIYIYIHIMYVTRYDPGTKKSQILKIVIKYLRNIMIHIRSVMIDV